MEKKTYTRAEIFDLLWVEPATKVAKRIGIPNALLADWCRSSHIPKPKLGYWLLRALRFPVPKMPALPKCADGESETTFNIYTISELTTPAGDDPIKQLPLFSGEAYHSEVLRTFKTEGDGFIDKNGRWIADAGFTVEVGPASIYKTKVILQTIIDAMLAKGFEIEDYQGIQRKRVRSSFILGEERIFLALYESSKKLAQPIPKKECSTYFEKDGSHLQDIEFQGAGKLEIRLGHANVYPGVIIREKPNRSLEETLGVVIRSVQELCIEAVYQRMDREAFIEEAEKEKKRLADIKRARDAEALKWGELKEAAEQWNELAVIREFVQTMKTSTKVRRKNKDLKEWASWAEEQINARDPVYKVASGMGLPGQNEPVSDVEA